MYNKVLKQINSLLDDCSKDTVIVAIDGSCAAGKSTLTEFLQDNFNCNVFHMDDFFLTPQMKTQQRLSQPGGNVDFERFKTEVIDNILAKKDFVFDIYDCHRVEFRPSGKVFHKKLNIVEGVYSMHPHFGNCYDLKIFMDVQEDKKHQRILHRSSEFMLERFKNEWIPLENRYFEVFNIKENSHIVIDTTDLF